MTSDAQPSALPPELLEIIRCPACLGEFLPPQSQTQPDALVCSSCGLRYPVRNGVPILLVDEAEPTSTPSAGAASTTSGTD